MSRTARRPPARDGAEAEDAPPTALGPVVVTDLELTVLEAAHRRLLAEPEPGVPWPEEGTGNDDGEREARRSLVARGLLTEGGELAEDSDVAQVLATVLDIRVTSDRVLVVERVVAAGGPQDDAAAAGRLQAGSDDPAVHSGARLVHLVASAACVEDLLADRSHHLYLLLDRDEVVPWVTGVTVPPDAAGGTGPVLVLDPERPDGMAAMLGHPSVLAELSVLASATEALDATRHRQASPAHHLLALGPSGCWVTDVEPGRSLPASVVCRPVGRGWVAEWVRSALGEVPTGGPEEAGGRQGTMSG